MVKVTFLGTNGWFDSATGNTISVLVSAPDFFIVLDAGNGIAKLAQYIEDDRPVYLFLSHFHLDHITGLHSLVNNKFSDGLFIIVQEGGREILHRFVNTPFTVPLAELPFSTEIIEVPKDGDKLPFQATFRPLLHKSFTLGVRLTVDGRIIAYCPDTGYCKNAVSLARDADLLIAECAFRPKEVDPGWPHLNPEQAARIAGEAKVKKLVLTHFDAKRYPDFKAREEAEQIARGIFKASWASKDGMEIEVTLRDQRS